MSSVRLAPANVIRHCYPALAISLLVAGVGALSISSLSYRAAIPFSEWSRELVFGVKVPACFKSVKQEVDFLDKILN